MKNKKYLLFWILITFCTVFFRFYHLNWDLGNYFHPDERNIAMAVSRIHFFDQMDPEFFAYGGLPIYLYRATGELLIRLTHDSSWVLGWDKINLIGRFYSALFSTLTLIPLFFLAKKVFGEKVAYLTAFFYSCAVFSIQTAHFGVTESMITFFAVSIVLISIHFFEKQTYINGLMLGILCGLALAAKTSAISFLIAPGFTFLLLTTNSIKKKAWKELPWLSLKGLTILCVTAFLFCLLSPYTFLSWDKFMESMHYESGVVWGTIPVPYTLQFTGTPLYLFQLYNFLWQMGLLVFLLLVSPIALWKEKLKHKQLLFLFLIFPLGYFLYVGSWFTKFIRYMVPILPFFIILACVSLAYVMNRWKRVGKGIYLLVAASSIWWAMSFMHIYFAPQTRVLASSWIYSHIPTGEVLLTEHWDDGLPINLPNGSPSQYPSEQLTLYDVHQIPDVEKLANQLARGKYVIINSRRLYGTLTRLTKEYPYVSWYYKELFVGKLGYKKVAEFESYPSFLGVTIPDDLSEETFQVYDHPKVMIFQNTSHLSEEQISRILLK
jgi:hypothetical protein